MLGEIERLTVLLGEPIFLIAQGGTRAGQTQCVRETSEQLGFDKKHLRSRHSVEGCNPIYLFKNKYLAISVANEIEPRPVPGPQTSVVQRSQRIISPLVQMFPADMAKENYASKSAKLGQALNEYREEMQNEN